MQHTWVCFIISFLQRHKSWSPHTGRLPRQLTTDTVIDMPPPSFVVTFDWFLHRIFKKTSYINVIKDEHNNLLLNKRTNEWFYFKISSSYLYDFYWQVADVLRNNLGYLSYYFQCLSLSKVLTRLHISNLMEKIFSTTLKMPETFCIKIHTKLKPRL